MNTNLKKNCYPNWRFKHLTLLMTICMFSILLQKLIIVDNRYLRWSLTVLIIRVGNSFQRSYLFHNLHNNLLFSAYTLRLASFYVLWSHLLTSEFGLWCLNYSNGWWTDSFMQIYLFRFTKSRNFYKTSV